MANFDEMAHFLTLLEAHGARRAKGARTESDARTERHTVFWVV